MDIGLVNNDGSFKLRSSGVIVKDGKMLVARSRKFDGYVFFGGHIMLGENSRTAIVREAIEELGFDVEISKLICVNENIFINEVNALAHEIAFYYLLDPVGDVPEQDFEYVEHEDGNKFVHKYKWIDVCDAAKYDVRPKWLVDMIIDGKENFYYLSDQVNHYE